MSKSRASLFVIGILIAMLAASLLTVLGLYLTGALVTNPVDLVFSVNAVAPKEYDGVPLRATGYSFDEGSLKNGHKLSVKVLGEQLNSGSSESDLVVKVLDEKERDVTNEYAIKVNKGLLTVTSRPLTVILKPAQIPYSGSEVPIESYDIYKGVGLAGMIQDFEPGELLAGHRLVVSFPGRFENVGDTIPSVEEWKDENFIIYDTAGNDVTRNYQLEEAMLSGGPIEIVPRRLSVKALDVTKPYDGTPVEGKFELVEGTLAPGHYIGSVKYANERGEDVSLVRVGSERVRVVSITVCTQEGYSLVPLDEELQKNYQLSLSLSMYGTLSVTKRSVTVRALNMTKNYDGGALNDILEEGVFPFTADLPEGFRIDTYRSELSELVDVCDRSYSIESVTIKEDNVAGAELTDQFEISYIPATARIIPVTVKLSLLNSDYSENYTGEKIAIFASNSFHNFDGSIERAITGSEIKSPCSEMLQSLKPADFTILCNKTVKNVGVYEFNAELKDEVLTEKFNKKGNVIFEICTGLFEVNRVNLSVGYFLNGAEVNVVEKVYDGREAALDYRDLNVVSADTDTNGLSVFAADFRYENYGNHTKVNTYNVKISGIRILATEKTDGGSGVSEDVTANYLIPDSSVVVKITPAMLYARAAQSFMTYEVETLPSSNLEGNRLAGNLAQNFRHSVDFSGLASGDMANYDVEYGFTLSGQYDSRAQCIRYAVEFEENTVCIFNSQGEDVTDCYVLQNTEPIITLELVEASA